MSFFAYCPKTKQKRGWYAQLQLCVCPGCVLCSQGTWAYGAGLPLVLPEGDTWVTRIFIDVAKLY